jgi:metallo-beta-lactamase class B
MRRPGHVALVVLVSAACAAQQSAYDAAWNQPAAAHKIIGDIYFVGTNELASFLVTTRSGHILIDTGFEESVPLIRDSVRALGFKYEDIRMLLSSHAHADHAGGLALVKRETGARLHAMRADAARLESGGRGDPQFGNHRTFTPVTVDRALDDGDRVELGGLTVIVRHTPGHTPGSGTFITIASDRGRAHQVVFAPHLAVEPDTVLVDNPEYPDVARDWQRTFAILESLTADVWVSPHTSAFDMKGKLARLRQKERNPYDDPEGFRRHLASSRRQFGALLAEQIAARP